VGDTHRQTPTHSLPMDSGRSHIYTHMYTPTRTLPHPHVHTFSSTHLYSAPTHKFAHETVMDSVLLSLGWLVEHGVSEVMYLSVPLHHIRQLWIIHISDLNRVQQRKNSLTVAHRTKPCHTLVYNTINLTSDTSFIHIVHHRMHIKTVQSTV